jgi:hypothetical protein
MIATLAATLLVCHVHSNNPYTWTRIEVNEETKIMNVTSYKQHYTAFESSQSNPGGIEYFGCWGKDKCISLHQGYELRVNINNEWIPCEENKPK